MRIQVECYSGYTYAQEPRSFHWQGRRLEVTAVLRRWLQPSTTIFVVEISDKRTFRLSYYEIEDVWDAAPISTIS